jgi:hypothetical protein
VAGVTGQVDPAPGRPGGPLVVVDLAAARPAHVGVVDLSVVIVVLMSRCSVFAGAVFPSDAFALIVA